MILVVPWPGMSTIESRGIDISTLGPDAGVQQHDRVGPAAAGVAGVELLALLLGQAGARVAADHEVRRPRLLRRPVAVRLERDLLDVVPGDDRHRDQVDQPQQQQDEHVADPEAAARRRPDPPPESGSAAGRTAAASTGRLASVGWTRRRGWVGGGVWVGPGRGWVGISRVASGSLGGVAGAAVQPLVVGPSSPPFAGRPRTHQPCRGTYRGSRDGPAFGASATGVTPVTGDTGGQHALP